MVGQVYELADAGSALPHALIEQLVAFDVQMIEGSLRAVSPDDRVRLILTSARGDEWDLESDDPIVLQAIQRLPGAVAGWLQSSSLQSNRSTRPGVLCE